VKLTFSQMFIYRTGKNSINSYIVKVICRTSCYSSEHECEAV